MREIKFRAFDIENKEMLKVENLYFNNISNRVEIKTLMYSDYFNENEMILMQYTGLKDKNGKEIYEGDIVTIQFDLTSTKSKVEWLQEISGFIVKDVSILDDELAKRIVVIGNIYNNPELLEKEGK